MTAAVIEHLPLLAGAPGGGAGLRRLILDLAVSGRLVPQDPADVSAEELIARAAAVKATIGSTRKARGGVSKSGPVTWDHLPTGWAQVRLGELTTKLGAGSTPLGGKQVYTSDGVMFLRSQNVWNEGLRLDDIARIPAAIHADMAGTHVFAGDLLFNITGASIGRCAVVPFPFEGGNVSQHVVIVRPALPELQAYLHKVLISDLVQDAVMAEQVGVSREGLSVAKLSEFKIPLPPLAEQLRIVAKVDELMALCDRLEARQQDAEAVHARLVQVLLDNLTQARDADEFQACWQRLALLFPVVLTTEASVEQLRRVVQQLGVMGRLTSRQPNDGSAADLLAKIAAARSMTTSAGRQKGRVEDTAREVLYDLPAEWCWSTAELICEVIVDCPHSTPKFVPSGVLCLDTNSVKQGRIVPERSRYVDETTYAERVARLTPRSGDVVFAREGSVGESVVVPADLRCCLGQRVMLFRPCLVEPAYLQLALSEPSAVARQLALHKGIGAKHVNVADMRAAWVPLPPLPEQRRIVAKVAELLALCDQLKARIAAAHARQGQLAEVLVAQAVAA